MSEPEGRYERPSVLSHAAPILEFAGWFGLGCAGVFVLFLDDPTFDVSVIARIALVGAITLAIGRWLNRRKSD